MIKWERKKEDRPSDGQEVLVIYLDTNRQTTSVLQSVYFDRLALTGWGDIEDGEQLLDDSRVVCWAPFEFPLEIVQDFLKKRSD